MASPSISLASLSVLYSEYKTLFDKLILVPSNKNYLKFWEPSRRSNDSCYLYDFVEMADFRKYTRNDLNAWEAFLQKIDSRSLDQLLQEEKYARDNREELKRCLGEGKS
jgi:hypothetical protein